MKRPSTNFLVIIAIILFACENVEYDPDQVFTVEEFYDYCDTKHTACGELVHNDGDSIRVKGEIRDVNYFPEQNKFFLYQPGTSQEVQIYVLADSFQIFTLIDFLKSESPGAACQVILKGIVETYDTPTLSNCSVGVVLNLFSVDDVFENGASSD